MKFNKPLFAFLFAVSVLSACGSAPEKPSDQKPIEKAASKNKEVKSDAGVVAKVEISSSVLPVGPVTPNPYLQNPQKFSEQVEVNFRAAVVAMQQKNWDFAESTLKQLAEKNPKLSGIHLNLGIVYRNKGNAEKAAEAFNLAINANMKNVDAYNQLAVLKREAGDFAAAESLYQKALGIWPFYPEGHKNIAILYDLYLGKPEQALPHYQAYQQLLSTPDKQVDSWVADVQRRLNAGKASDKTEAK
ncbi:MAG TPA: tetratricopeptide repeat protein [Cellvibrio sp.]|nr:tetratricopeptide repeat protein [Cellvibrio sp.]